MLVETMEVKKVKIIGNNIFKGMEGVLVNQTDVYVEVKIVREDGLEFIYKGKKEDIVEMEYR